MNKKKNSGPSFGFWATLIVILTAGFFGVAPNFVGSGRGGPVAKANACKNNLRQIDAAAYQFALENHLTNGDAINFPNDLTPYIKLNSRGKIPSCPSGGTYTLKNVGDNPTCSLSTLANTPHALQ